MRSIYFNLLLIIAFLVACQPQQTEQETSAPSLDIDATLAKAGQQLEMALDAYQDTSQLPRSVEDDGTVKLTKPSNWTSGFFPGSLWLMYDHTGDEKWRAQAERWTTALEEQQYNDRTHDTGFMMYCSYGEGLRLTGNDAYNDILLQTARTLSTRYNDTVGCIKSWDWSKEWQYPVIIDNMMNLELLMWAAKKSGDSTFSYISNQHALTTMEHHYRADNSCWHVVNYDTLTGEPISKVTHQGFSDESAWARGQAWGLYGYIMMFDETGNATYLDHAQKVADFMINHPNMPKDMVPYWDFDAPEIPNVPRDASAGAIMASALILLSEHSEREKAATYLETAQKTLASLASPEYMAELGSNHYFLLKHSTGNKPQNSEVDKPLVYADYYFLEALLRLKAHQAG